MDIREYLENNRIITDGAMGTWFEKITGYTGELAERGNLSCPEIIQAIHRAYIDAGAKLIRTNTFAVNSMFFSKEEIHEVLRAAWKNAETAVHGCGGETKEKVQPHGQICDGTVGTAAENPVQDKLWIAADMGPISEDETRNAADIIREYRELCSQFLDMGAEVFVFETLSELRYIADAVAYIKEQRPDAFIITQFAFNRNGLTRSGWSAKALMAAAAKIPEIDAVGFNCGVGPLHLYEILKNQVFPEGKYLTALPNAGYPAELRGRMMYSENVPYYVEMMEKIAALGVDMLGGCCGTTPAHIEGVSKLLEKGIRPPKKLMVSVIKEKTLASAETAKERLLENGIVLKNGGVSENADGRWEDRDCEEKRAFEEKTAFKENLMRAEKVFVVELDPPFTADDSKLMTGAALLRDAGVDMITLADSPLARPRADAIASAIKMRYTQQIEVMPHMSCRDKNRIAHRAQLIGMHMNGLRHALVVTGDPIARGDRESIKSVFNFNSIQLMRYIQTMNQEVFGEAPIYYGGALNHNHGSLDVIAGRMRQKMEAGASWFMTQPVYGSEDLERLAILKEKTGGRILAGIMPLVSRKNALFIKNEMPGIHVPDAVLEKYKEGMSREEYEAVAIEMSMALMRELKDIGDGYYLMTPFNRASLIERIITLAKKEL